MIKNYSIDGIGANVQLGKQGGYINYDVDQDSVSLLDPQSNHANLQVLNASLQGISISNSSVISSIDVDLSSVSDQDDSLASARAIRNYVDNNSGDGLVVHGTITHDSSTVIGAVPNVSARTYRAHKVVVNVTTAFSGGSFSYITIQDGDDAVLVDDVDCDAGDPGTYIIDVPTLTLAKNQNIVVAFKQEDGSAATPTAGAMTVAVHYTWD